MMYQDDEAESRGYPASRLHHLQLEIAGEIRKICIANNIKYFIIAGTLLGAVRHKGFIPWDDDMDIGMLRPDYDRFLSVAAGELPSNLFLQTWHSDKGYGLPIAKVRKQGTRIVENISLNASHHKGIFIDIFPFDEKPASALHQAKQNAITYIYKRIVLSRLNYTVGAEKSSLKNLLLLSLTRSTAFLKVDRLIQLLEREMRRYNTSGTGDVVAIGGSYGYKRETLKRKWVDSLTEVEFEGERWPAFELWPEYLEHMYGDYMQLPPVEQRGKRHGVIEIDLGERS
ncbi:LicD family protein [Arthrobacter sp. IA7]|uniref:LicD family protein n=1 Tax=Arthrobacter ipis TaxID=2716202 RepID=UPI00168295D7|nr:LicD family protein [Arthrobacter ipis]MBD1541854.1 LicD family protein [Arthrobacter ipis]